jgi:tetratricopeptide (TPR) repeat protein
MEIIRKLFTEQEREESFKNGSENLSKELQNKNYLNSAIYSLDIAHICEIAGDREKADHCFRTALECLDRADHQPLWVRLDCLSGLGNYEKALQAALNSGIPIHPGLALLYEKAGKYDIAQELYSELALGQCHIPYDGEAYLYPHFLQYTSDLWEKAHKAEEVHRFNRQALKAWEKVHNNIERSLYPIEVAWLHEEVGYIYEKAGKFEIAMDYYKNARKEYEMANKEEYIISSGAHQVDGDWDYYMKYFSLQLPGIEIIKSITGYFMKYHLKRIEYRILNLKEQIKIKNDRS